MKVAVLIPTRDRPEEFHRAAQSVLDTSQADVLAYIDEDQVGRYGSAPDQRVKVFHGDRVGPVGAANRLVEWNPGYHAYGLITDDARMVTPGWDEWLLEVVDRFPVCVVSPCHNQGNHVDMPFVTRRWIGIVGWFACPSCHHYAWPIITGLIGEMSAIIHAPRQSFSVHHPHKEEMVSVAKLEHDHRAFFEFVALKLPAVVERLRAELTVGV